MATMSPEDMKVFYTTANVDMDLFHKWFDEALERLRANLGKDYPAYVGGKPVTSDADPIVDTSPINTDILLGKFTAATADHVEQAVAAARAGAKVWSHTPWQKRIEILRNVAKTIRKRKFDFAALMSLEVGKSRLESLGDAEEAADLIDYYCTQMEEAQGYVRKMNNITPVETNTDVLRPYGVFACIAPFNFPLALSTGMSSAALTAGNAVIYKPAKDTPWTGLELYRAYIDGGVPAGVINYLTGRGADVGDNLTFHPGIDGVVFTGSKAVGLHIFHGLSKNWVKPCLMELGGKNPAIVMDTADLDKAAEGVMKSAWGLQNQKCSACSRVYVHQAVADAFIEKLVANTKAMKIGDPTEADVFFGPVINNAAVKTWQKGVDQGREEGEILFGGNRITDGAFAKGHYVEPTIAKLPLTSSLFMEELFVPFLSVGEVDSLDQAITESNRAEYGLTAGIYTARQEEIDQFFDEIESGVTYVNKRTGATTGAWPGAQPFCGWKGSGGSGKGGCGPYYVSQFMREQSRCVVED